MKKKNGKSMWFIVLAFIFIFSTGQICTLWEGINNGQGRGSDTEQEVGEEEDGDEETDESEND
ncbi:MAG: hypothetical protein BroJett011_11010 [Chloroflexota bacterium]|nr:MAG: hypothetical protein BroJett011_11010 [Chloroflexota bacterium]